MIVRGSTLCTTVAAVAAVENVVEATAAEGDAVEEVVIADLSRFVYQLVEEQVIEVEVQEFHSRIQINVYTLEVRIMKNTGTNNNIITKTEVTGTTGCDGSDGDGATGEEFAKKGT